MFQWLVFSFCFYKHALNVNMCTLHKHIFDDRDMVTFIAKTFNPTLIVKITVDNRILVTIIYIHTHIYIYIYYIYNIYIFIHTIYIYIVYI